MFFIVFIFPDLNLKWVLTFTALSTTAALACASLGVIRSHIDWASLSLGV